MPGVLLFLNFLKANWKIILIVIIIIIVFVTIVNNLEKIGDWYSEKTQKKDITLTTVEKERIKSNGKDLPDSRES